MESSPFDARKHNLMILSWGFPKSFFALQIIPHTNKQELVATTTWHQINPILPLFHKICLTWSGIYLPLSQRTFISTQTNMFSASNLFSTGMGIAKPPSPSPIPTNRPTWIFLLNIISFGCIFLGNSKKWKFFFAKPLQNRRPLQSPVCQSSPPPRGDGNCMLMMMVVIACYSIIIISANDDDKGGEIMTIVMLKMVMRVFDLFIARQGAWYDRGRGSSVRVFVYLFFININHQPFFPFYPKLKAWGILKLK